MLPLEAVTDPNRHGQPKWLTFGFAEALKLAVRDRSRRRWQYGTSVIAWRLNGRRGATEAVEAVLGCSRGGMPLSVRNTLAGSGAIDPEPTSVGSIDPIGASFLRSDASVECLNGGIRRIRQSPRRSVFAFRLRRLVRVGNTIEPRASAPGSLFSRAFAATRTAAACAGPSAA